MSTNWPKVIVVGDPRLGDLLASSGAQWQIQPVAPTVSSMWDAIEAGSLDGESAIVVISDGTSSVPDELEATLAQYAPYADTFLFADTARAQQIIARAQALAATMPGCDPSKPIWALPVADANQAIEMMKTVLGQKVVWPSAAPPPAPPAPPTPTGAVRPTFPVAPAAPAPAPAVQPYQPPAPAAQPAFAVAPTPAFSGPSAPGVGEKMYSQSSVYSDEIIAQAGTGIAKNPNALPGQITIACMSSKGGSGKSTTALSLAGMIAKASAAAGQPKRVVLVDLDTRDGQVGSLIGQYMPTSINIRVMPKWDAATVKANLVHDKRLGIDALLAPVRPRNADDVGPDFYRHIIGVLQTTHDIVVMDCSVNYLDPLLGTAFQMADEILFVTTLATTSVQGMARSLTELFADPADGGLGIPREKVGIVANQVINNVGMGKDKLLKAALGAPLVGQIPADQDAVLIATNSNRMADLLAHPKLGPAYFRLAQNCLPSIALAPLTAEQAQAAGQAPGAAPAQPQQPQEKKRGLFGR